MSNDVVKSVKGFAIIAFLLLGVLFGMQIMNFIFVQLGPSSSTFTDLTVLNTNQTGAYINQSTFTISEASNTGFNGGFTVLLAVNSTDGLVIPVANYTVDAGAGTIINATTENWGAVNLTYTYSQKSSAEQASENIQNNSLQAIVTYTEQSDTQFNTIAIAITLIILIAVFLLFWKIFVNNKKGKKEGSGGNFGW